MGTSSSKPDSIYASTAAGKQGLLRQAFLSGDLKTAQELLDPQPAATKPRSPWRSSSLIISRKSSTQDAAPAGPTRQVRLDWLWEEDLGAFPLAYLACGSLLRRAQVNDRADAHDLRHFVSETNRTAVHEASRTAAGRLQVLQWLLSPAQSHLWGELALDRLTHRAQTILHCLLLNGGHADMLQQLLQWWLQQAAATDSTTGSGPTNQPPPAAGAAPTSQGQSSHAEVGASPSVSSSSSSSLAGPAPQTKAQQLVYVLGVVDDEGRTPLDLALLTGNWRAARWLIAAGIPQDWGRLAPALTAVEKQLQVAAAHVPSAVRLPHLMEALFPVQRPTSFREAVQQLPTMCSGLIKVLSEYGARPQHTRVLRTVDQSLAQSSRGAEVSVKSLQEPERLAELQEAVQQVCATLGLDEAAAFKLLSAHSYDVDAVLAHHMASVAFEAAGEPAGTGSSSTLGATASASAAQEAVRCEVCWEELPASHFSVRLSCGHHTCDGCWRGVLRARLDEGDPWRAACPHQGCGLILPTQYAKQLLPQQEHQRLFRLLTGHYVTQHPRSAWCPRPGCGKSVHLSSKSTGQDLRSSSSSSSSSPGGAAFPASGGSLQDVHAALMAGRGVSVQCACGMRFCFRCGGPPHEPATCVQVEFFSERARKAGAAATEAYLSARTRKCVRCKALTERTEGCNHMTCTQCGAQWCWACGRDWAQHGRHTGGYYQCSLTERSALEPENHNARAPLDAAAQAAVDQQLACWGRHRRFVDTVHALAGHAGFILYMLAGGRALSASIAPISHNSSSAATVDVGQGGGMLLRQQPPHTALAPQASPGQRPGSGSGYGMHAPALTGPAAAAAVGAGGVRAMHSVPLVMTQAVTSTTEGMLLQQWLHAMCRASEVLAWGHLLLSFMLPGSASWFYLKRKLQCLQVALDRLAQPLLGMPHADHVLAAAPHQRRAAQASTAAAAAHAAHPAAAQAPTASVPTRLCGMLSFTGAGAPPPDRPSSSSSGSARSTRAAGEAAGVEEPLPWEDALHYQLLVSTPLYTNTSRAMPLQGPLQQSLSHLVRRALWAGRHERGAVGGQHQQQEEGAILGCSADVLEQLPYVAVLFWQRAAELEQLLDEVARCCAVIIRVARLGHMLATSDDAAQQGSSALQQHSAQGPELGLSTLMNATRGAVLLGWQSTRMLAAGLAARFGAASSAPAPHHLHEA